MKNTKITFNHEDKPPKYSLLTISALRNESQTNNLNLKTVSAESLRSISPGSDSVFYSDPCNKVSTICTRCNNEVDVDFTNNTSSEIVDIVKPPEGFGDSPEEPHQTTSVKRSAKRYRSEERRRNGGRSEQTRAKSEERAKNYREKGK